MKEARVCLDLTTKHLLHSVHRRRFEIRDDNSGIWLHPKLCAALLKHLQHLHYITVHWKLQGGPKNLAPFCMP